jgi:hypothetical protein
MPSAVDSMNTTPFLGTPCNEPVVISSALAGYLAAIFPISEMCRKCGVPPRADDVTSMEEPLLKTSWVWVAEIVGRIARTKAGRLS